MTDLEMLKKLTGESDEELIQMLLEEAQSKILALTSRTVVIDALRPSIRDLTVIAYNRLGMQGESSRSEGGISSAFVEVPQTIQDTIKRYRIARVGGYAYETVPDEEIPAT